MEETGLIQKFAWRIFRLREVIFLLSFSAVMCLPLALQEILKGVDVNVFVPITLLTLICTTLIVFWNLNKLFTNFIFFILSPLALFIHLGGMWLSIFELLKQLFYLYLNVYSKILYKTALDFSFLLSAWENLTEKFIGLAQRITSWLIALLQGIQLEDPLARTFIWSVGILSIAIWAGWQIAKHENYLIGILPSTIFLALSLDYTRKEMFMLWVHVILLLLVIGFSHLEKIRRRWESSNTDYSDSTVTESIVVVSILAIQVLGISYFVSTVSIKDILENIREREEVFDPQVEALGLEQAKENKISSPLSGSGSFISHEIQAGPQLSNQIVMVILTGDLPPMPASASAEVDIPNYYWRTGTYQMYTGSGWMNPASTRENISANDFLFEQPEVGYKVVHQNVIFTEGAQENLYWTGNLLQANVPLEAVWIDNDENNHLLYSKMLTAFINEGSYQADSLLLDVDEQTLKDSLAIYPDWISERYLALPESVPDRVRELARDLTISESTPYERALAIQNYLREFPYTLDVPAPPSERDAADYFLFELRQGYCDYYATSMVVMARSVGLPARIVMGYASGSYDIQQAKYFVAEKDAHAWVEIYFAEIGWVEFEPTPSQPAPAYGAIALSEQNQPVQPISTFNKPSFSFLKDINWFLPIIIFIIFLFMWMMWDTLSFLRLEPSFAIRNLYNRLRRFAQPLSGFSPLHETAHQYALALTQKIQSLSTAKYLQTSCNDVNRLTNLYSQSLFAPQPISQQDAQLALKTWWRLRWKLLILNVLAKVQKQ